MDGAAPSPSTSTSSSTPRSRAGTDDGDVDHARRSGVDALDTDRCLRTKGRRHRERNSVLSRAGDRVLGRRCDRIRDVRVAMIGNDVLEGAYGQRRVLNPGRALMGPEYVLVDERRFRDRRVGLHAQTAAAHPDDPDGHPIFGYRDGPAVGVAFDEIEVELRGTSILLNGARGEHENESGRELVNRHAHAIDPGATSIADVLERKRIGVAAPPRLRATKYSTSTRLRSCSFGSSTAGSRMPSFSSAPRRRTYELAFMT